MERVADNLSIEASEWGERDISQHGRAYKNLIRTAVYQATIVGMTPMVVEDFLNRVGEDFIAGIAQHTEVLKPDFMIGPYAEYSIEAMELKFQIYGYLIKNNPDLPTQIRQMTR